MSRKTISIIALSFLHLTVDGFCAFSIFSRLYPFNEERAWLIFFLYNSLAFITQPLTGFIVDKYKNYKSIIFISVLILMISSILPLNYLLTTIILGICNSFFHVAGGKYTLLCNRKYGLLGLFVSLGAIGLGLGTIIPNKLIYILFVVTAVIAIIVFYICSEIVPLEGKVENDSNFNIPKKWIAFVILLIVAVFVRAFVGKAISYSVVNITILVFISMAMGKLLGGFIADFIGLRLTTFISMIGAFILLLFYKNGVCLLMGTILFNMSMPLTLGLMNNYFKNFEGFGFGILASVLFPGYLLAMLIPSNYLLYVTIILIGVIYTIWCIIFIDKKNMYAREN